MKDLNKYLTYAVVFLEFMGFHHPLDEISLVGVKNIPAGTESSTTRPMLFRKQVEKRYF